MKVSLSLILCLCAFGVNAACLSPSKPPSSADKLDLETVVTQQGQPRSIAQLMASKERLVLHFWASWCAPCIKELPEFAAFSSSGLAPGISFVAVNNDAEGSGAAQRILSKLELGLEAFEVNVDQGQLLTLLGVPGLPATVVFDGQGRERQRIIGSVDWTCPDLASELLN
ncbi:MAG: TlpA disulfide reductase family protein [Halopseudomonas sp.]